MNKSVWLDNESTLYEYDLEEAFSTYNLYDLIPTAVVYGITLVVGLVGNFLIIYTVASFRRMRTISNVFLASLAVADLLLVAICVPVKFGQLFSYTWSLGEFCCKFVYYIQSVSSTCSVLTLTSMSVERYYAILHPVKSRYLCTLSQARRVIAAIWVASFVTSIPVVFVQVHVPVGERYPGYWCVRDWDNPTLWRLYELYMLVFILLGPACVMAFAYIRICTQLWVVVTERANMAVGNMPGGTEMITRTEFHGGKTSNNLVKPTRTLNSKVDSDNATVKQVIKMLVAVVVLFVLCWGPILITNVLTAFNIIHELNYGVLKAVRTAFHLLSYFNSCVNPCVYGFMSTSFRHSFKVALSSCLSRGRVRGGGPGQSMLSRTRTTSVSLDRRSTTFIT